MDWGQVSPRMNVHLGHTTEQARLHIGAIGCITTLPAPQALVTRGPALPHAPLGESLRQGLPPHVLDGEPRCS